jgi:hypothetical protein
MEMNMMENSKLDRSMVKAHIFLIMEINILECFIKTFKKEKELWNIKMEINLTGISK